MMALGASRALCDQGSRLWQATEALSRGWPTRVHVDDDVQNVVYCGQKSERKGLKASIWAKPYKELDLGRRACIEKFHDHLSMSVSLRSQLPTL